MLYYEKIGISKVIDPAKSNNCKELMICYYCFFNHGFKFQNSISNDYHSLTMLSVNVSDIAIIPIEGVDYNCIIQEIRKSEETSLLKDSMLEERGHL